MIATGVVRGRPLLRPLIVTRPLGPNGTPAAKKNLVIELKTGIPLGTRSVRALTSVSCRSLILGRTLWIKSLDLNRTIIFGRRDAVRPARRWPAIVPVVHPCCSKSSLEPNDRCS
jgi:hypothetical protein